jgi:cytochrome c-type biogenesis protein CcmH/NrfG
MVHVRNWILSRSQQQPCSLRGLMILVTLSCIITNCAPQNKVNVPIFREEPQGQIPLPSGQTGILLANANKAMQTGELDKAEMQLERALRLSPSDAQLWHGMARVRFEQGNYAQAVQFCLKSNSLAGKNGGAIVSQNWLLMEKAYMKTGETEKATQARQKAGERY